MKPDHNRAFVTFCLFTLGFFTSTWDTLLTIPAHGFHFKIQQVAFLAAFLAALLLESRGEERRVFFRPLRTRFAAMMLALGTYYVIGSPWSSFPLKSLMYSAWFFFQLIAVWLTGQFLARKRPVSDLAWLAWGTVLFHAIVILVDQVAYRYGYVGGLIGNNQDAVLHWGVSRPHAFSYEPSYAAAFLSIGIVTTGGFVLGCTRRKALAGLGLIAAITAVVLTTSRTGWFGLAFGMGLLLILPFFFGNRPTVRTLALYAAAAAGAIGVFVLTTPASQRSVVDKFLVSGILTGADGSGHARLRAHVEALQIAKDTHWLGSGLGASYKYHVDHSTVADYLDPHAMALQHYGNELVMSIWGQLLAEGGLPAVLLYAVAAAALLKALFRRWRRDMDLLALGSLAGAILWFGFSAFWLGNICRGDVWVWLALWGAVAFDEKASAAAARH